MEDIKRLLALNPKDITLSRVVKALLRRIADIPNRITWFWPFGFSALNRKSLNKFQNIHLNKRCFIIANGPSLNQVNFDLLKNEITIGMNRIYLMEKINGFKPNYLVCIDKKSQLLQFTKEFNDLEQICFFNWDLRHYFEKKDNQIFVKGKFSAKFSKDITKNSMGNGKSVTYSCIQIAFFMGFKEVYIIGKDHSYDTLEKAGLGIKSDGNENNHFVKGYYKSGMNWDAPDYKTEEYAYSLSRIEFEKAGRIIRDATINGKLDVFEKVDYLKVLTANV